MAKREYCKIQGLKPSPRTMAYIEQMNHITDMSTILDRIMKVIPFFQIFAGRGSYKGLSLASASYNVETYNWNLYHDTVMAIEPVKRERLEQIALSATLNTSGEERKFWECVYNAL
ncbi:hypothetical protein [Vibrio caribbeanicus]|uniref:Uncharacterized protein n=1 Tax=Vibrio caribbeanicus ATCC BAA-2122 TaxID=796620 RepID=E3BNY6_9VIBR|nr:hypothetical protein [Vibrio caribbeanicus]EFP95118.1 hypothetical protein VIBC2010_19115 [Vibrio caribbeanicus ATCC BAA-2122]